jgi:hypothetical protein
VLSALQERLAGIMASLPEARDFALAGGAALIATRLVDRETRDLDFFADRPQAVMELLPCSRKPFVLPASRSCASGHRLVSRDGVEATEVDLCHDVRLWPVEVTRLGAVLAAEELAADKMLAFFARALPRDLVDVYALARRYGFDRLCELAAEKDRGFNLAALADALGSTQRLPLHALEVADSEFAHQVLDWAADQRARILAGKGRCRRGGDRPRGRPGGRSPGAHPGARPSCRMTASVSACAQISAILPSAIR